jgi:hypothetical protein
MACLTNPTLNTSRFAGLLFGLTAFTGLVCAGVCASKLEERLNKTRPSGFGFGVLFLGMLLLYGASFFIGCTAVVMRAL